MEQFFEGSAITEFEGRIPAIKVLTPEAYKRGTILKLTMEVRVKSVRLEENKDGDLTRSHVFVVESINVDEAFDPTQVAEQLVSSGPIDVELPADVELPGLNNVEGIAELQTPIPDYPALDGQTSIEDALEPAPDTSWVKTVEIKEFTPVERIEALEEVGF
jgi:hypothetical protein